MAAWANKLVVYQINTWVWLNTLSRQHGRAFTLANVPDEALDALPPGIDMVWFMGVWQRSEFGQSNARNYKHEYVGALPDITDEDIIGSAYAIGDYTVDKQIGGREGLAQIRRRLRERGIQLMLDYVPNHLASDHHWIKEHPEYFVQGKPTDVENRASDFYFAKDANGKQIVIAHGRDPLFPGWADTAQLNAFNPALRQAVVETLLDIAAQCDGVRCDMAMLLMNDIFAGTWRGYVGDRPETDYWNEIIPKVRAQYPDFMFAAEVYWGKEYELLQQGFDYCYDKVLYDRIREGNIGKLRQHLIADLNYQKHMMRFIENHDEHRAYDALGRERSFPAATLITTLPGAVLLHDGQLIGRRIKLPVQIKRQPDETPHRDLEAYYHKLLTETRDPIYQNGDWYLFEVRPMGDGSHNNLLAYGWYEQDKDYRLIVVNMTAFPSKGFVNLGAWSWIGNKSWRLYDVTDSAEYIRAGSEMTSEGLGILLDPFESHVFRFEPTREKPRLQKKTKERSR